MGLDPSWIQIIPVSPPKRPEVGDQRGGRRVLDVLVKPAKPDENTSP